MQKLIETARRHINVAEMMSAAREVAGFHRIQASTGYRAAAEMCKNMLERGGVSAEMLSFAAAGAPQTPCDRPLREWDIRAGTCEIAGLGEIADFNKIPLSVICRSMPADFRASGLEVVYLDKSAEQSDYSGLALAGKLVFVRGNINDFAWAWNERGATGIFTDYVLDPDTQQDVVRYTSFWWSGVEDEKQIFGFALPPRLGKRLAEHCISYAAQGKPVIARGFIDSAYYDGHIEIVSAFLPGEREEEILITAHLCHPQASANDNASGVAAGMQAMLALRRALDCGDIPPLARGVRLLLLPEMRGTYEYLRRIWPHRGRILAGINLDMVGGRQDMGCGPLELIALPLAGASFTEYAAEIALEKAVQTYSGYQPSQKLPSINHAFSAFSGGSDHYILSDPTVGIPTTMLGQWPDGMYHTSGDTYERLCPDVMSASCATAFGLCAALAGLTPAGLPALFARGRLALARRLEPLDDENAGAMLALLLGAAKRAASDSMRFFPGDEAVAALTARENERLEYIAQAFSSGGAVQPEAGDSRVPTRLYLMPVENLELAARKAGHLGAYKEYSAANKNEYHAESLACYYMDGERTVGEIIRLTALECGQDAAFIADYIDLLEKCGLVAVN